MHRPPARRLPLPYLQIINPLEGFIGTEDQDRNKQIRSNPSIRRKTFLKLSIPLARISGTRIIGSMASPFFFYLLTPLIFLHSLIFPNNLPSRVLLMDSDVQEHIETWLSQLDDKQRAVVARRFGLDGQEAATLEELGNELGVTRERVRQIQLEALKRLRRILQQEGYSGDALFKEV